jgi:molybdopterin-guanine dinucleotide biosynthesis protein A
VVDRVALLGLRAELDAGRLGCFSAFRAAAAGLEQTVDAVSAEFLAQSDQVSHPDGLPAARWFFNFNSPQDLREGEAP